MNNNQVSCTEGILIHGEDDVVTLTKTVQAGQMVFWNYAGQMEQRKASTDIPQFHKMACRKITKGQKVKKYGHVIGIASQDIQKGEWVHTHNLKSCSEEIMTSTTDMGTNGSIRKASVSPCIQGYRRPDGKFGIRNYVLILPCSLCASETARFIAENVRGSKYIPNQGGCSLSHKDYNITMNTLSGIAANPNVYGTIIIGNGCEVIQADALYKEIQRKTNKPLYQYVIRKEGGSLSTINKAVKMAKKLVKEASQLVKVEADISELLLGTECGGSDPTSGLVSNPVVGETCDILVKAGGSCILSETPEMIGAENVLAQRAKSEEIQRKLLHMIKEYEKAFLVVGENPRNGNPTPGNIAGGITTLEEKSLGCIHKSGSTSINEVIGYAETGHEKGLIVMDTPGQDIASIAGMAAAGAQLVLFTTGHGTPTGFGIVPVIKITANEETAYKMSDHIDFDCCGILTGQGDIINYGENLYELIQKVSCGQKTKSEQLGFNDMSIARCCNFA